MQYEKGKELVLDDDSLFLIIDTFELKNNRYLFLIDEKDKKASLVKIIDDVIHEIEDDNEFDEAFNELINRNKREITE